MGINLVIAVTDGDWFEMLWRQPDLADGDQEEDRGAGKTGPHRANLEDAQ